MMFQVVLVSESTRLQAMLQTYGIQTQTPHEVEPVQIWDPSQLVKVVLLLLLLCYYWLLLFLLCYYYRRGPAVHGH